MGLRPKAYKASVRNGKDAVASQLRKLQMKEEEEKKRNEELFREEIKQVLDDIIEDCECMATEENDFEESSNDCWEAVSQNSVDSEYESDQEVTHPPRYRTRSMLPQNKTTISESEIVKQIIL